MPPTQNPRRLQIISSGQKSLEPEVPRSTIPAVQNLRPEEALFESVVSKSKNQEEERDGGRHRLPIKNNPTQRLIPERFKSGSNVPDRSRSKHLNQRRTSTTATTTSTTTTTTTFTPTLPIIQPQELFEEVVFETEAPVSETINFVPLPTTRPQTQVLISRPEVQARPASQSVQKQPQVIKAHHLHSTTW